MPTRSLLACGLLTMLAARVQAPAQDTFAAISFAPRPGDVEANRKALLDKIASAAHHGARFVVLPELSLTGSLQEESR